MRLRGREAGRVIQKWCPKRSLLVGKAVGGQTPAVAKRFFGPLSAGRRSHPAASGRVNTTLLRAEVDVSGRPARSPAFGMELPSDPAAIALPESRLNSAREP